MEQHSSGPGTISHTLEEQTEANNERLLSLTDPLGNNTLVYLKAHALRSKEIIRDYRLGSARFRGLDCLAIPYLAPDGRVLQIRYRCVEGTVEDGRLVEHDHKEHVERGGKYLTVGGSNSRLYNTSAYLAAGEVIGLAEGEPDSIAATAYIGIPTMGYAGSTQWKAHGHFWEVALRDFQRVVIFADGDAVGVECARGVAEDLGKRASIVRCDNDMDVASMVAAGKENTLIKRLPS